MVYSHSLSLPWSLSAEDERRFRRILTIVVLLTFLFGVIVPLLPVPETQIEEEAELPPRLAKLIFEKRTTPRPEPKPEPVETIPEPKPETSNKPQPKQKAPPRVASKPKPKQPPTDAIEQARKKASTAGLLAMQDSLADLRDQSVDELRGDRRLNSNGAKARETERKLVSSRVGSGSAGINTSNLSRSTGSTRLASRTATEVKSAIATSSTPNKSNTRRSASRSKEDIQMVFDRNKSAIFNIYNRALRKDPMLQGKLVIRLSIAPSGRVTSIELVSSELNDQTLERKLLTRIKMIDFGAKKVDTVTITYPIDFLPA